MRLIRTSTMTLEEFWEDSVPEYAILSHTWAAGEVSFQDFHKPDVTAKAGYLKIKMACDQATENGLNYVWVDTCCIDKSSSAELSEAINSMYQWYRGSTICYVYISDFETKNLDIAGGPSSLSQCRWFTRGWTLQELIAPKELLFFDKHWKSFGTGYTLSTNLEKITGIDSNVMHGKLPLSEVSIARRMSWASKRETTRTEDIAYCLLGIFDVNMPLLYGEGKKAFTRLLETILGDSDDHSIFAWSAVAPGEEEEDDERFDRQSGLLASSPAQYADSKDVVPFRKWGNSTIHTMTNKGLSIQLDMSKTTIPSVYFTGVLDCWAFQNSTQRVAILLKCIDGDQFCRISSTKIFRTLDRDLDSRRVFFRRDIILSRPHDVVRAGIIFNIIFAGEHYLIRPDSLRAEPANRLDKSTKVFYAAVGTNSSGILSFEIPNSTVLIVFGLGVLGQEPWCLLSKANKEENLKKVYLQTQFKDPEVLKYEGWTDELWNFHTSIRAELEHTSTSNIASPSFLFKIRLD